MHTSVNVVIPVYRPDDKLIKIISMLNTQTVPVSKIIIMHTRTFSGDEADQNAKELVGGLTKSGDALVEIHDVKIENFDHGNTRREGAAFVTKDCDYIVFMTQDAVPENNRLIENLLEPFQDAKVGASYARQVATENSTLAEKFTRSFNYPDKDSVKSVDDIEKIGIKAFFCSNVCAMYRKEVLDSLGGFVRKTVFNEDMIFANKLLKSGYQIAYASGATVIHTHDYSGMQQYKRNFDLAVSQVMNPQAFYGISSESEGIKYVKAAFLYFLKHKRPFLIVPFGINCVYKYLGYRKGKKIAKLSEREIMKATSNPGFFKGLPFDGTIIEYVMKINDVNV